MTKIRKNISLDEDIIAQLERYLRNKNLNTLNFSQAVEMAIENLCEESEEKNISSNPNVNEIEKRLNMRLNAIGKEIRLGNIVQLRAFHNLNVDVEDMSFDINNTQLEFLAKIDFDNELKKKQTKVSETRKVQQPIMKNKNPLFDRS
ncbi:hypothetical protein [Brochothrix thermosphacta]|uniref:hypothetical protein n=1 Tax=Brochothrix thermosphacta TaxID=2756 RepID=UPI00083F9938|nr:hypothetical protein [Brochothrix thermosphacta]ODJ64904.1 hypothetical protein BFR36_09770 [Brochothrix thermosphacta]SOC32631.1 protein of unknown function [Brochothrix thermosphacta]